MRRAAQGLKGPRPDVVLRLAVLRQSTAPQCSNLQPMHAAACNKTPSLAVPS